MTTPHEEQARFPSLGDREEAHNTTSMLGEAFLMLGGHLAMSVAAAGYPQRRAHSALFAHIDVERGSRLTELAARSSVTPQAMSDVVNDLVRLGYVERRPDPDDGRAKRIFLTDRGLGAINEGRQVIARIETRLLEVLGEVALGELRSTLATISRTRF